MPLGIVLGSRTAVPVMDSWHPQLVILVWMQTTTGKCTKVIQVTQGRFFSADNKSWNTGFLLSLQTLLWNLLMNRKCFLYSVIFLSLPSTLHNWLHRYNLPSAGCDVMWTDKLPSLKTELRPSTEFFFKKSPVCLLCHSSRFIQNKCTRLHITKTFQMKHIS